MGKTTGQAGWNLDNSYLGLPQIFYTRQNPTPVHKPQAVIVNRGLAISLGLDPDYLSQGDGLAVLAGNKIPPGAAPLAQAYAGHRFGHFTLLGDGRALLIGEQVIGPYERRDIQLKGSGPTPYSRGGDGKAALGPMLREYIISEAMHALSIPTSRSLAVVTTGEPVYREKVLSGAILVRVASSHLRVGTFQYGAVRGTMTDLQALADYAIERHYPQLAKAERKYFRLLEAVLQNQAQLIAQWMLVGFVHGVMNTDNMAISGETIDYGPCAFLDMYDPATVFSSIDRRGRYAYGNQPQIAQWNLTRFAEAILPLLDREQKQAAAAAHELLKTFPDLYEKHWLTGMGCKLGISPVEDGDKKLFTELLELMRRHKADYTNTFLDLTFDGSSQKDLFQAEDFLRWKKRWRKRLERETCRPQTRLARMRENNPAVIPRNHRVEEALRAAVQLGDLGPFHKLLAVLTDPHGHTSRQKEYAQPPPASALPYRTFCGT